MNNLDTDSDDSNESDGAGLGAEDEWNFDLIASALTKVTSTKKLDLYEKRLAIRELKAMCTSLYEELNERSPTTQLAEWFFRNEDAETNTQLVCLNGESQRLLRIQRERRVTGAPRPPPPVVVEEEDPTAAIRSLTERLEMLWLATYTPTTDPLRVRLSGPDVPCAILQEAAERLSGALDLYQCILRASNGADQRVLEKQWGERTEGMGLYYPSAMWKKK